jgi:predicted type IV restriction endonuclease
MPEPTDEQLESVFEKVVFVRYIDHVMYNRTSALTMQPQVREAVGWLVYEAENYIIISYDRDAGPPTLHGGDPKASGLVLLKSDILRMAELNLKSKRDKQETEYAFRPTERKTLKRAKSSKGEN